MQRSVCLQLPHVRSSKEDWLHMQKEETDVKGLQNDCRRANGRFCYCKRHSHKTDGGKEAQTVTDSTFRWAASVSAELRSGAQWNESVRAV